MRNIDKKLGNWFNLPALNARPFWRCIFNVFFFFFFVILFSKMLFWLATAAFDASARLLSTSLSAGTSPYKRASMQQRMLAADINKVATYQMSGNEQLANSNKSILYWKVRWVVEWVCSVCDNGSAMKGVWSVSSTALHCVRSVPSQNGNHRICVGPAHFHLFHFPHRQRIQLESIHTQQSNSTIHKNSIH